MTGDRSVFVDTNVLLAATAPSRPSHQQALWLWTRTAKEDVRLLLSGQVLREYLSVATRPSGLNGLGLTPKDASANVVAFRNRARFVAATEAVFDRLTEIAQQTGCRRKAIHDANIVATAITHGADILVTENTSDFKRFRKWIEVVDLSEVASLT